jgi:hypothetical protein
MGERRVRSTLKYAIEEGGYQLSELSDEMREAFEGTPEVFQGTTGRPREVAADNLEVAYDLLLGCNVPEELRDEDVEWIELRAGKNRRLYRPARRDNVVSCLRACIAQLATVSQDDEISKLKNELQTVVDILDAVFFPGMTGRRAA